MKNSFYNLLSYTGIIIFCLYWAAIFIGLMPPNHAREFLQANAPWFTSRFNRSWKFFTPPYTYNHRLYYITRDIKEPGRTDTIEVLEKISLRKQQKAPFYQRENIVDNIVNGSVAGLLRAVWSDTENRPFSPPVPTGNQEKVENYARCLATLQNYSKVALKANGIDLLGKEVKIAITQKMIPPFKERSGSAQMQPEILVFETPYTPLGQ